MWQETSSGIEGHSKPTTKVAADTSTLTGFVQANTPLPTDSNPQPEPKVKAAVLEPQQAALEQRTSPSASVDGPDPSHPITKSFTRATSPSCSLTGSTAVEATPTPPVSGSILLRVSVVNVGKMTSAGALYAAKNAFSEATNCGASRLTITNIRGNRSSLRAKLVRLLTKESVYILSDFANTNRLTDPRFNLNPILSSDKREITASLPAVPTTPDAIPDDDESWLGL